MKDDLLQIENKARMLANQARLSFGFNVFEPVDISKVFQIIGITLIKKPLKGDISGIFLKTGRAKVILINSSKTLGHQNFTAAHELYHSEYDDGLEGKMCKAGKFNIKNIAEVLADFFATHFLMPEEGIRFMLAKKMRNRQEIHMPDIIFLEQFYSISHTAMLNRLIDLKIINKDKKGAFLNGFTTWAKILGYDDSLYLPTYDSKILSEYAELAKLALDRDLITYSRYEELLADADLLDLSYLEEVADYVD